jgi:hypothetical protein
LKIGGGRTFAVDDNIRKIFPDKETIEFKEVSSKRNILYILWWCNSLYLPQIVAGLAKHYELVTIE